MIKFSAAQMAPRHGAPDSAGDLPEPPAGSPRPLRAAASAVRGSGQDKRRVELTAPSISRCDTMDLMASISILVGYLAGRCRSRFCSPGGRGSTCARRAAGNVGAANVLRTTGIGRALAVMVLDVAKGAAAVGIAVRVAGGNGVAALTGAAAVVGHIYPVWLRFHGGKGVAVAAGVFACWRRSRPRRGGAVSRHRVVDAVRLARLGRGDGGAAARGLATRRAGAVVGAAARHRRADPVPPPSEPAALDGRDGPKV